MQNRFIQCEIIAFLNVWQNNETQKSLSETSTTPVNYTKFPRIRVFYFHAYDDEHCDDSTKKYIKFLRSKIIYNNS